MYTFIFRFKRYKKIASVEKELQQVKKDNAALARYINARRRKEEAQTKAEEEVQSSKDVQTWRK
jgi:hypothetical protein